MRYIREILEERFGKQCIKELAKGKGGRTEQAKEMIQCNEEADSKICKHCGMRIKKS